MGLCAGVEGPRVTASLAGREYSSPIRGIPAVETEKPMCAMDLKDGVKPRCPNPKTEVARPTRAKLRGKAEEPSCIPSVEREVKPNRDTPIARVAASERATAFEETNGPRCA